MFYNELFKPIVVATDKQKQVWILDGQHRLKAYEKLTEEKVLPENIKIPVYVISVDSQEQAKVLFQRINVSQPYFELPEHSDVLKKVMISLQNTYPDAIRSDSGQKFCQIPRIMASKLERDLSELIENEKDYTEILRQIKQINAILKEKCSPKVRSIGEKLNDFYLGCEKNWYKLGSTQVKGYENVNETRIHISSNTRKQVWGKIFSDIDGECYGCTQPIDVYNYIVAHITPLSKKGTNDLDNLYPLCKDCNSKMGSKSFERYFGSEKYNEMIEKITY